jgi:hypothetical protein
MGMRGEAIQRAREAVVASGPDGALATAVDAVLGLVCERVEARRDRVVWRGLESESNSTEALTLNWVLVLLRGGADQ